MVKFKSWPVKLMHMQTIGAEAKIRILNETVVKDRPRKGYRLQAIDEKLRKGRTRREAKIIAKLHGSGFPVPKIIDVCDNSITMQRIKGKQLKEILNALNFKRLCKEAGTIVAKMHDLGIIHSDLTTSNMIYAEKLYLIDFGLAFESQKEEDKAVDLHLFRQALESKHFRFFEKAFDAFIDGYKASKDYGIVMKRFKIVESRGRNKELI